MNRRRLVLRAFRIGSAECGGELMKAIVQERYGVLACAVNLSDLEYLIGSTHDSWEV
jgi:hypothetical protein